MTTRRGGTDASPPEESRNISDSDRQPDTSRNDEVSAPPSEATKAVLLVSEPVPEGARVVRGVDFDCYAGRDITVAELVSGMSNMGFQASAVAEAVRIINEMVRSPIKAQGAVLTAFSAPGKTLRRVWGPLSS
jgi:hypothetical protein